MAKLAHSAQSERVRMMALQWLADAAGEGPKQEVHRNHSGRLVAGLVIVRASDRQHSPTIVNGMVIDRPKPRTNRIGTPVPHPSQVKREAGDDC